ncbi:g4345 [Coccomyxa viridis]|uniref:peptidyl-tRNA hydrolase n=1 Tax=Coccomyxa viridis TaxID=1274662 RepID=A0ABP1FQ21_9CHLO
MDSSTSMAFQPKSSRFSNPEGSSADHGIANGDSSSGSSVDTKMALVVRLDLSMSVGELTKHCCTASIGQYKKLYKIKAPELKQWEKGGMKKECYGVDSEEELVRAREAARQEGFATRGVVDGEERLVQLMIGPGSGAKLSQLLSGMAKPLPG